MDNELLIYQSSEGSIKIDVRMDKDTVWLTQKSIARLFGVEIPAISKHIGNIYQSGELNVGATISKMETVQIEGTREITRYPDYYNLDVIIAVGYRVNSHQATQFRIWATQVLKEFIIKGFVLNDERMKTGKSMNYFDDLQDRIREIRLSERVFYQKVLLDNNRFISINAD